MSVSETTTNTASIIVDLRNARCSICKVLVHDPLAKTCHGCGATFDRVVSNHVGLARKLQQERAAAGVETSL